MISLLFIGCVLAITGSGYSQCTSDSDCKDMLGYCHTDFGFCRVGKCRCGKFQIELDSRCYNKAVYNESCIFSRTNASLSNCPEEKLLACNRNTMRCECQMRSGLSVIPERDFSGCRIAIVAMAHAPLNLPVPKRMGDICQRRSPILCPGAERNLSFCDQRSSKCRCKEAFTEGSDGLCYPKQIGDQCQEHSDCWPALGICSKSQCICKPNVKLVQDADGMIKCGFGYPSNPCLLDSDQKCKFGAECNEDEQCVCPKGTQLEWASFYNNSATRVVHVPRCVAPLRQRAADGQLCLSLTESNSKLAVCERGLVCGEFCANSSGVCHPLMVTKKGCGGRQICVGGATCEHGMCLCTGKYCSDTMLKMLPEYIDGNEGESESGGETAAAATGGEGGQSATPAQRDGVGADRGPKTSPAPSKVTSAKVSPPLTRAITATATSSRTVSSFFTLLAFVQISRFLL